MTDTPNLLDIDAQLVQASHGKRFANYLIDIIAFFVVVFILSIIFYFIFPAALDVAESNNPVDRLVEQLIWAAVLGVYFGLMEVLLKGRTIGKYLTGTKAVNMDGTPITAGTAFARGFFRVVPFEAFSALGSPCFPWHDKWSKTYVVDIKESILPE